MRPEPALIRQAADVLKGGGMVAFPTETFYGLGVNARDAAAVARVFVTKGRPADKPLLVLVDSLDMVPEVAAALPERARSLIGRHWPGPLTLILPARPDLPAALTAGTGGIGVRLAAHPVAHALVRAAGVPVTAPSANAHGAPSPRTAADVLSSLGGVPGLDLVLDAGPTPGGPPSTVLDVQVTPARVVRAGAIRLGPEDLGAP